MIRRVGIFPESLIAFGVICALVGLRVRKSRLRIREENSMHSPSGAEGAENTGVESQIRFDSAVSAPLREKLSHRRRVSRLRSCAENMMYSQQVMWWTMILFLGALGTHAHAQEPSDMQAVKIAREAAIGTKTNLRSGSGIADYEHYAASGGQTKLELKTKARCTIEFDKEKYLIRLEFAVDRARQRDRQIIVHDGKIILVNDMGKRYRPLESEGSIHDVHPRDKAPNVAGFAFDPARLPQWILDVEAELDKNHPDMKIEMRPSRIIAGSFSALANSDVRQEFEMRPEDGYNVSRRVVWNSTVSRTEPVFELRAEWAQAGGVWYVNSVDHRMNAAGGLRTRSVLKYATFLPNVAIPSERFQLRALEFKKGIRILDHRPDAPVKSYNYDAKRETESAHLDSLVAQVESMPIRDLAPAPPPKSRRWQWILISVGAVACLAGLLLIGRRYWTRRTSPTKSAER